MTTPAGAVPVPGPDTPTWTIDDDGNPLWGADTWTIAFEDLAYTLWTGLDEDKVRAAHDALVADVRAARVHERCVELETYAAKLEEAGLLRSEYPEDMARRSCTCTDDAVCGAHRLLVRYHELWEEFRAANKAKREAQEAARVHEGCGPAGDTLRRAREWAALLRQSTIDPLDGKFVSRYVALLDTVDGGGDG